MHSLKPNYFILPGDRKVKKRLSLVYIINKISNVMVVCPNTMQKERRGEGRKVGRSRRQGGERKKEGGKKGRKKERKGKEKTSSLCMSSKI